MRLPRLVALAATIGIGFSMLAVSPVSAEPPPPAAQAAELLPGAPQPDSTPTGCNRGDLPADHARCFLEVYTPEGQRTARTADAPPPTALTPEDIKSAYNLPDGGEGQTVAVVLAYGHSAAESDLAVFRKQFGLPECTTANGCFRKVDQRGGTDYPPDDPGWAAESALDLDSVSAVCPRCDILLVEADSASVADLSAAVETAVRLDAKFVSNSYGIPGEADGQQAFDERYSHPGVVVTVSSGDIGNLTSWPATNPDVVAVGGTTLTRDPSTDRGWTESPWSGGGSGCSPYEPRPDYQKTIDTNCPNGRAIADIAADADPRSGLAVYHSITSDGRSGWVQYGGTSLSSPLVAAMYALAGTPSQDTYPVTYPYAAAGTDSLFDIDRGSNGSCGNVLCQAGPGWDGPTGVGTPNGLGALTFGPAGTVSGHLTDRATGQPVSGAVTARNEESGRTYRTDGDDRGAYTLKVPAGTYTLTASSFGYAEVVRAGVVVRVDQTVTAETPMEKTPSRTVSGRIIGDAGHTWPLAASITVDGAPYGAITTDPHTGRYSVELPQGSEHTLRISAAYPGYTSRVETIDAGDRDVTVDATLKVDRAGCTAPGYAYPSRSDFEGWTGSAPQDGWTVSGTTPGWEFTGYGPNFTNGSGNFAAAAPAFHDGTAQDTSLTSPTMDMSGQEAPHLRFQTFLVAEDDVDAAIELSLDDGATWEAVGHAVNGAVELTDIALPQAAGRSGVRVRFHFTGHGTSAWELDDITVGDCAALPGGLVAGTVTDANTGRPVAGATVNGSLPTAADGRFWTFAGPERTNRLTASARRYTPATASVRVADDAVARRNWALEAGRLSLSRTAVSTETVLGRGARTQQVRLTNTGDAPLTVSVSEQSRAATGPRAASAGDAWVDIADYPVPIMSNMVGSHQGLTYSFGGRDNKGTVRSGYVYDPATDAWSPVADLPEPVQGAGAAFLDGTLYVTGGYRIGDGILSRTYAYDPAADRWTRKADLPTPVRGAAFTVLGKHLYLVGGYHADDAPSAEVYRYDPRRDTWSRVADYPAAVNNPACAGISDRVVCAGGHSRFADGGSGPSFVEHTATHAYSPRRNTWTRLADMPYRNYLAAYSGANGRLQVASGVSELGATNRATEYDPVTGSWHALPNVNHAEYYAGSGCGLYKIGGSDNGRAAEVLPGYDSCDGDDVSWLRENSTRFTIAPGHSRTLTITTTGRVGGAGDYAASLVLDTDSPYRHGTVDVAMKVRSHRS